MSYFTGTKRKQVKAPSSISDSSDSFSAASLALERDKLRNMEHKPKTQAMYHSVWRKFNQFLIELDHMPPTWEEKTSLYCTYLIKIVGVQSSTIKSYISAIKYKLRTDGYQWNDQLGLFSSLVHACRNSNDLVSNRLPIQGSLTDAIAFELNRMFMQQDNRIYLITLYRTIFLVMYQGLMRIGEVSEGDHVIKAAHVHEAENKKQFLIMLYSSKTHGKGNKPQTIYIKSDDNTNSMYNTVDELRKYVQMRPPYINTTDQFFIFPNRANVRPDDVRRILKCTISNIGLDPDNYDTHSFHIGRATDLFKAGTEVETIKKIGRWESNAIYKYLRF